MRELRVLRPWLLFGLLVVLVILLTARDDLRQNAAKSSESAIRYVVFDMLGWSPREVFIWRLRLAGLVDSPLGQQWIGAVERANKSPFQVGDQYRASEAFADDRVEAHVFQVTLERGEKLIWQLSRLDASGDRLYASLEHREREGQGWSTVAELSADGATSSSLVSRSGDYRIVLQPELFARLEYSLAIASGGSLPFPVEAASQRDIGSSFGAPRDGGAREHHGVDIFADRGTPVRAVMDGRVRTGTGGIGGNHVWLSSGLLGLGGARYYYAHLDSFAIESGDRVKEGEILGYVGNTGNASNTPPHLHFGIYSGGPVDPAPFLKPEPVLPER
ncbi:M23 family metallopeptidase [Marinobacter maritimus]|uniref:M23 family metallopeptidase n=1 Tax=Marinobacter maritimus TaxID=277961 RepID=UPI0011A4A0D0|nr:M23 family metallopeptidase [Marinobacter maritimus]